MPRPLPPPFNIEAFLVADGLAAGITQRRLRGRDLARPFRGVRAQPDASPARAYAPLLRPGDRFSHSTAAALWPVPLPRMASAELHVTAAPTFDRPKSVGVIGHRSVRGSLVQRQGLPVSDPGTLFIELATQLSVPDLVAVGDALVLDPAVLDPRDIRPYIGLDELRDHCENTRAPGCRAARQAVKLVRDGAESRPESLLRLLLTSAGLPEPELNQEIFDARGFIGRFDMVYREQRVIVEYDGDQHRTSTTQYVTDQARLKRAAKAQWTVERVRADGLWTHPARTVGDVREALGLT